MPELLVKKLETIYKSSPRRTMVFMLALLIIISSFLLIPVVGVFGQTINRLEAHFTTEYIFRTTENIFISSEVHGIKSWGASFANTSDSSGEDAKNVALVLASNMTFSQISPPPSVQGPTLESSGPPLYRWLGGNVPQHGSSASIPQLALNVSSISSPVTFAPGFNAYRSANMTVFHGPGLQTLTVTVTPETSVSSLVVSIEANPGNEVKARIVSPKTDDSQGIYVSPDGSHILINKASILTGVSLTFTITLDVNPVTDEAEFMPRVRVETYQRATGGTVTGSSITRAVADLGAWTWNADGNFEWSWTDSLGKVVTLDGYAKGLVTAAAPAPTVTPVVSPSSDNSTTADALQTPEQKTIEQTGSASILALIITAVFLLTSTFFNSSLKSNYETIQRWVKPIIFKSKLSKIPIAKPENEEHVHIFHLRDYVEFAILLVINALITTFSKQPSNMQQFISAFIPSLVNATIITAGYAGTQVILSNKRYRMPAGIRMHYIAIIIAILFVVFTRVVRYPPILIYGFVGGYFALSLSRRMNTNQRAKAILLSIAVILVFSIVSFYIRGPIHNGATTFWRSILDNTLAKIVCGGLLGLLLSLLPFDFMDGAKIKAWNFWIWLSSFYIVAFAFAYYVVIKDDNLIMALKSKQTIGVYVFMGIWILIGFGSWLFFRLYHRRAKIITS
jgi:hypothetical protein